MQELSYNDAGQPEDGSASVIAYGDRAKTVYDWVLERILTAEFEPGSFLDKQAIAEAVGVSRQPVTVALSRLAREGWVEIENRVGSYVARINPQSLREICFLWFAFNSLTIREMMASPPERFLPDVRRLREEYAALDRQQDCRVLLERGEEILGYLVKTYVNEKAASYFDAFRLHFRRFLAHAARHPGMIGDVEAFYASSVDGWLVMFDNILSVDIAAVMRLSESAEVTCGALIDRFEDVLNGSA
jgi:DNA-binding GntR family transcriptional regulator